MEVDTTLKEEVMFLRLDVLTRLTTTLTPTDISHMIYDKGYLRVVDVHLWGFPC